LLAAFVTTELVVAHPMFDLALQLLMRGLDAGSTWTHLIPGMIAGGAGIGLASGINNTFRQVGLATGIALLGALFSGQVGAAAGGRAAFTADLNRILLVGVIIALAAGLISLIAIRRKDFAL
jgi:hypothetical protein